VLTGRDRFGERRHDPEDRPAGGALGNLAQPGVQLADVDLAGHQLRRAGLEDQPAVAAERPEHLTEDSRLADAVLADEQDRRAIGTAAQRRVQRGHGDGPAADRRQRPRLAGRLPDPLRSAIAATIALDECARRSTVSSRTSPRERRLLVYRNSSSCARSSTGGNSASRSAIDRAAARTTAPTSSSRAVVSVLASSRLVRRLAIDSRYTLLRRAKRLKERAAAADAPLMDAQAQADLAESLAGLELLVFGGTQDDDSLVQKFLTADATFTAHFLARLASEPVVVH